MTKILSLWGHKQRINACDLCEDILVSGDSAGPSTNQLSPFQIPLFSAHEHLITVGNYATG